jgi:hypothetical protein
MSFIFGGGGGSTSTQTNSTPAWAENAVSGMFNRATAASNQGYTPNPYQRVAGFTSPQTNAFQLADANVGSWGAPMQRASTYTAQGANASSLGAASPYLGQAGSSLDRADGQSASRAGSPYIGMGVGTLGAAAGTTMAGTGSWVDAYRDYENPYRDQVTNRIAELGTRNLMENILPQVNSTFTGAGQFGSSRNAEFTNRAIRDTQNEILGNVAQSLERGYGTSANIYNADQGRRLQAGSTLSGIGSNIVGAGTAAGNLVSADRQNDIASANARANLGQIAGNFTNADASRKLDAARLSQAEAQNLQQLGQGDVRTLLGTGALQQEMDQRNLDTLNKDFYEARDWEKNQIGWLGNALRGQNTGTTTTTSTPGPSTAQTLGGLGLVTASLGQSGAFGSNGYLSNMFGRKAGGLVAKFQDGGGVDFFDLVRKASNEDLEVASTSVDSRLSRLAADELVRRGQTPARTPVAAFAGPATRAPLSAVANLVQPGPRPVFTEGTAPEGSRLSSGPIRPSRPFISGLGGEGFIQVGTPVRSVSDVLNIDEPTSGRGRTLQGRTLDLPTLPEIERRGPSPDDGMDDAPGMGMVGAVPGNPYNRMPRSVQNPLGEQYVGPAARVEADRQAANPGLELPDISPPDIDIKFDSDDAGSPFRRAQAAALADQERGGVPDYVRDLGAPSPIVQPMRPALSPPNFIDDMAAPGALPRATPAATPPATPPAAPARPRRPPASAAPPTPAATPTVASTEPMGPLSTGPMQGPPIPSELAGGQAPGKALWENPLFLMGMSMLASKSPNFIGALGEAGLNTAKSVGELERRRMDEERFNRQDARENTRIDLERRRIDEDRANRSEDRGIRREELGLRREEINAMREYRNAVLGQSNFQPAGQDESGNVILFDPKTGETKTLPGTFLRNGTMEQYGALEGLWKRANPPNAGETPEGYGQRAATAVLSQLSDRSGRLDASAQQAYNSTLSFFSRQVQDGTIPYEEAIRQAEAARDRVYADNRATRAAGTSGGLPARPLSSQAQAAVDQINKNP